ncbi:MAG: sigma 54 modulation/S30EA ribosomal C-terminal domain-containing protein, partial [Acidimicrobiia bacterium]|nr:sigma 54 modulation/S30EA ribosomal C-terminal domain-containing protein [Acidimicrobiia bacterium]
MSIDPDRGCVYIVRRGRSYEAPISEVESAARVPSARVRFKLRRNGGSDQAEQVRLRTGTRTSKRQRRFGDLTGAHEPGAKVATTATALLGVDVTTQPLRVVQAWLGAVGDANYDGAVALYHPSATVHTLAGPISGRRRLRAVVELSDQVGEVAEEPEVHGIDQYVRAACRFDGNPVTAHFKIESGQIAEQWLGLEPTAPETGEAEPGPEVLVVTKGDVLAGDIDYASSKLDHACRVVGQTILLARMKLTRAANPAIEQSAMAEATLDIDGDVLRAHATAPTMTEAIDTVIRRLHIRLEHRSDRERHKPTGLRPAEGEWRRGNLATPHVSYFDRPAAERELVRHKSFAADELTLEEAAWDMAMLDYDFFLFVELSTGDDALLERTAADVFVVHQLDPGGRPDD